MDLLAGPAQTLYTGMEIGTYFAANQNALSRTIQE
jgi:hypothetical protein